MVEVYDYHNGVQASLIMTRHFVEWSDQRNKLGENRRSGIIWMDFLPGISGLEKETTRANKQSRRRGEGEKEVGEPAGGGSRDSSWFPH